MLRKTLYLFVLTFALLSCKKEMSDLDASSFLEVEAKNMGVVAKRTATWCGPCGDWGFNYFDQLKEQYKDDAVFMAFNDAFVETPSEGDLYFSRVHQLFAIGGGTPHFFFNFDTIHGTNYEGAWIIPEHVNSEVIANSNYEYSLSDHKIRLKTTTKFFSSVEGEFLISPFLIIDNQEGSQAGHPDSPNTVHSSFVANLAHPVNSETIEPWAYKVAAGKIEKGYQINLEFEVNRNEEWTDDDISFALVLYKRQGSKYKFVNAFTK